MSIDRSISIRATAISSLSSPVILLFLKWQFRSVFLSLPIVA
jgi:hypothetical protein